MTSFILIVFLGIIGDVYTKCPEGDELMKRAHTCNNMMLKYTQAEPVQRRSKCPDLQDGILCYEALIEDCRNNPDFTDHNSWLQDRMEGSRRDFEDFCGSGSAASFNSVSSIATRLSTIVCLILFFCKKILL